MKSAFASTCLLIACAGWQFPASAAELDAAQAATAVTDGIVFAQRPETSRFDLGANPRVEDDATHHRLVGDRGVFSVDTVTGATLAVLSAPQIPKSLAGLAALPLALTQDPDEHNAQVRRYLVAAGVPAAEIGGVHVTTTMGGGGPVEDGIRPANSRLLWYTTHLERRLKGIPVEGSVAFAALDSQGRAITEGVYWPAIPARVVRQALALKARMDAAPAAQAFRAQMREARPEAADAEGEVRIVHTGASHHGAFEARAVYSVVVRTPGGGKARIVRFDDAANVVRLADETPNRSQADAVKAR